MSQQQPDVAAPFIVAADDANSSASPSLSFQWMKMDMMSEPAVRQVFVKLYIILALCTVWCYVSALQFAVWDYCNLEGDPTVKSTRSSGGAQISNAVPSVCVNFNSSEWMTPGRPPSTWRSLTLGRSARFVLQFQTIEAAEALSNALEIGSAELHQLHRSTTRANHTTDPAESTAPMPFDNGEFLRNRTFSTRSFRTGSTVVLELPLDFYPMADYWVIRVSENVQRAFLYVANVSTMNITTEEGNITTVTSSYRLQPKVYQPALLFAVWDPLFAWFDLLVSYAMILYIITSFLRFAASHLQIDRASITRVFAHKRRRALWHVVLTFWPTIVFAVAVVIFVDPLILGTTLWQTNDFFTAWSYHVSPMVLELTIVLGTIIVLLFWLYPFTAKRSRRFQIFIACVATFFTLGLLWADITIWTTSGDFISFVAFRTNIASNSDRGQSFGATLASIAMLNTLGLLGVLTTFRRKGRLLYSRASRDYFGWRRQKFILFRIVAEFGLWVYLYYLFVVTGTSQSLSQVLPTGGLGCHAADACLMTFLATQLLQFCSARKGHWNNGAVPPGNIYVSIDLTNEDQPVEGPETQQKGNLVDAPEAAANIIISPPLQEGQSATTTTPDYGATATPVPKVEQSPNALLAYQRAIVVPSSSTTTTTIFFWQRLHWTEAHFRWLAKHSASSGYYFQWEKDKVTFDNRHRSVPARRSFFCVQTAMRMLGLSNEVYYDAPEEQRLFVQEREGGCCVSAILGCVDCCAGCGGGDKNDEAPPPPPPPSSSTAGRRVTVTAEDLTEEATTAKNGNKKNAAVDAAAPAAAVVDSEGDMLRLQDVSRYGFKHLHAFEVNFLSATVCMSLEEHEQPTSKDHQDDEIALSAHHNSSSKFQASHEFRVKPSKYIAIAFRGTNNLRNAITDAAIGRVNWDEMRDAAKGAMVHSGFVSAFNMLAVEHGLIHCVESHVNRAAPHFLPIVITGHSLGGALAMLCAYALKKRFIYHEVSCYTFGAPKVGNRAFTQAFDRMVPEYYRIVNENDLVSTVGHCGREHCGREVHVDRFGNAIVEPCALETRYNDTLNGNGWAVSNHLLERYAVSLDTLCETMSIPFQAKLQLSFSQAVPILKRLPVDQLGGGGENDDDDGFSREERAAYRRGQAVRAIRVAQDVALRGVGEVGQEVMSRQATLDDDCRVRMLTASSTDNNNNDSGGGDVEEELRRDSNISATKEERVTVVPVAEAEGAPPYPVAVENGQEQSKTAVDHDEVQREDL